MNSDESSGRYGLGQEGETESGTAQRQDSPAGDATTSAATARHAQNTDAQKQHEALFPSERALDFRTRWDSVQTAFVDEPRQSVTQADALVGEMLDQLAQTFRTQRESLEQSWDKKEGTSTEDLRTALRRYRTFFERLLTL